MHYDIFISYKHSDEFGNETRDAKIARNLHKKLEQLGYKVFFSSSTLEKIGSSRYKSDIDTALDGAKAMIVILTKEEYATSQWVQYEWDSFYNDYLSGLREEANLFTLTDDLDVNNLPRTLRNVQNFEYSQNFSKICKHLQFVIDRSRDKEVSANELNDKNNIVILSGKEITFTDIEQAVMLDRLVYDNKYFVDAEVCEEWFLANPDIYIMARDNKRKEIIAYVNISPVTDECYERIKKGDFIDTGITADMILSYMPFPYSVYFSSIVIHPDYQNTEVFMRLFNGIVEKFLYLKKHEVYIKRIVADAVTKNGEKFCRMFGMSKIIDSDHFSSLYEVMLIPPKFRILSKKTKELYEEYLKVYKEVPYLFDD